METEEIFHAPKVQPNLHRAAKEYLEEQGIVLGEALTAPKLLSAIADSNAARRLERVTRDGYYRSLALGAASYLYIDSRPDRAELLDACAARLRIKRKGTTNDVALVLRCVINYGEHTQQHRIKHRQFWSRDAKTVGELIAKGATPDQMVTELTKTGVRSSQRGCIASMAAAEGRPKRRVGDANPSGGQPGLWVGQTEKIIRTMTQESLLILAIRKKNASPNSAKVCGSITLRHPGLLSKLGGWNQLQKANPDSPKPRHFH